MPVDYELRGRQQKVNETVGLFLDMRPRPTPDEIDQAGGTFWEAVRQAVENVRRLADPDAKVGSFSDTSKQAVRDQWRRLYRVLDAKPDYQPLSKRPQDSFAGLDTSAE